MSSKPTLFEKLQSHFNDAAKRYPVGRELFEETLDKCKKFCMSEPKASAQYGEGPLFYKGLAYKVSLIDAPWDEADKVMGVFWDAGKLIKEHKGPKI